MSWDLLVCTSAVVVTENLCNLHVEKGAFLYVVFAVVIFHVFDRNSQSLCVRPIENSSQAVKNKML